jgi:hypothetical protein
MVGSASRANGRSASRVLLVYVGGIIGGWYKFGGRLNMLEYRVGAIEDTLKILSETLKSISETDKKFAVIDERQLALEKSNTAMLETIEDLRRKATSRCAAEP